MCAFAVHSKQAIFKKAARFERNKLSFEETVNEAIRID